MLVDNPVHTALPATDLERAKHFYAEKLGLSVEREAPEGVFFHSGNTRFLVFPSQGTPSGTHTQMGWTVDDIEAEVSDLKSSGVVFEEYDFEGFDRDKGIATTGPAKAAWFKDSEGNLLGLVEFT
jgi:predicted enzyme related to lactoylglutathione lyase